MYLTKIHTTRALIQLAYLEYIWAITKIKSSTIVSSTVMSSNAVSFTIESFGSIKESTPAPEFSFVTTKVYLFN